MGWKVGQEKKSSVGKIGINKYQRYHLKALFLEILKISINLKITNPKYFLRNPKIYKKNKHHNFDKRNFFPKNICITTKVIN